MVYVNYRGWCLDILQMRQNTCNACHWLCCCLINYIFFYIAGLFCYQGLVFGYASDETEECMPLTVLLSHKLNAKIAELRRSGELAWARPDSKTQVRQVYLSNQTFIIIIIYVIWFLILCFGFAIFILTGVRSSSVVRAFAHGAMGHLIDPSWWTQFFILKFNINLSKVSVHLMLNIIFFVFVSLWNCYCCLFNKFGLLYFEHEVYHNKINVICITQIFYLNTCHMTGIFHYISSHWVLICR